MSVLETKHNAVKSNFRPDTVRTRKCFLVMGSTARALEGAQWTRPELAGRRLCRKFTPRTQIRLLSPRGVIARLTPSNYTLPGGCLLKWTARLCEPAVARGWRRFRIEGVLDVYMSVQRMHPDDDYAQITGIRMLALSGCKLSQHNATQ